MPKLISRRRFIEYSTTLTAGAFFAPFGFGQTPDPYVSPYDKEATAELVTEGLDLKGKVALVTGCNSGLGYETMRVLAMRGVHVLGTARTMEKAEKACKEVGGKCTPFVCELSDFASVAACADAVNELGKPIDMLILNAGIMELPELEQVYGMEKQFVVNHLGHFVLANRLIDTVKQAKQGRVVVLSSGRYVSAPPEGIQFDNLSGEKGYEPLMGYGQSKLANALFSQELSRRLADSGSNATSNAVLPGVIMTNLGRHMPFWKQTLARLIGWTFMRSVEAGAATTCYVATNPNLATVSGHMFIDCNTFEPEGPHMYDRELATKLWKVSEELTKDYLV